MTDRVALWLGILIFMFMAGDFLFTGGATLLFLARKFVDMTEWVAFWR